MKRREREWKALEFFRLGFGRWSLEKVVLLVVGLVVGSVFYFLFL